VLVVMVLVIVVLVIVVRVVVVRVRHLLVLSVYLPSGRAGIYVMHVQHIRRRRHVRLVVDVAATVSIPKRPHAGGGERE
jgi:hypothetical protein